MISGGLFTRDFLIEGVRDTEAWTAFTHSQAQHVGEQVAARVVSLARQRTPTEAETEKDLIWPVLEQIGWSDMSVQQNLSAKARDDVPDALLFPSSEAKALAMPLEAWKRFQHGACVVEAKRWDRVLDREDARRRGNDGVPSTQMLRYLRRVDDVTGGTLRWGILTNGRHWRLYSAAHCQLPRTFWKSTWVSCSGYLDASAICLTAAPMSSRRTRSGMRMSSNSLC